MSAAGLVGQRLPPGFLPPAGSCQGCPWSTSVLWRCLSIHVVSFSRGTAWSQGPRGKAGLPGSPPTHNQAGRGHASTPSLPSIRGGPWTKDVAPPRRGGWPGGWERAPGHTSWPASAWPLSVPMVLTSLDTRLEPGWAPYRRLSPGRGAPQGLDLGWGTLHSQLCTHHSRDLEQVSHALGDLAVDRVCPHMAHRPIKKAKDSGPPRRRPVMAALSQHRRDSVPPVSLPGPRGLRFSRPFPAV